MRRLSEQAALSFLEVGVRRGDVVSVQLPNWNEFVVITLALERIGAVVNPIAPIYREREIRAMLDVARPVAVVAPDTFRGWDYPDMYESIWPAVGSLQVAVVVAVLTRGWRSRSATCPGIGSDRERKATSTPRPPPRSLVTSRTGPSREGWFTTGDRAIMDADGFIRISGRTKDIIIRGGENIPIKEIEDLILRHPAVRQVALVAVPDERLGERACACVVVEEGAAFVLEKLRAHLREHRVTPQLWPESVEILPELPMTPSGKIQKFRLRVGGRPGSAGPYESRSRSQHVTLRQEGGSVGGSLFPPRLSRPVFRS